MKVGKPELKRLIKECVLELLQEQPELLRKVVVESVGGRQPRKKSTSDRRRVNASDVVRAQNRSRRQRQVQEEDDDGFSWLVEDTLKNTLPGQLAGERSNPRSRSTHDVLSDTMSQDDGPMMRLRQAQMQQQHYGFDHQQQYMAHQQQLQRLNQTMFNGGQPAQQPMYQQPMHHQMQQQPMYQAPPPPPPPMGGDLSHLDGVSQSRLESMYKQQQQMPTHHNEHVNTSDDLSSLGIGNFDMHFDGGGSQASPNDLAAIAAEMNAGL